MTNQALSVGRLAALLNSSPRLHTYAQFHGSDSDSINITFPFIKTVYGHSSWLKRFPNATRAQLIDSFFDFQSQFPSVEELAINETDDIKQLLTTFPSLKVLHVAEVSKEQLDVMPSTIQICLTPSTDDNRNWWKYYSYDQVWGNDYLRTPLEYLMTIHQDDSKIEETAKRTSVEYERNIKRRCYEYKFPLVSLDPTTSSLLCSSDVLKHAWFDLYSAPDDPKKLRLYATYMPPMDALRMLMKKNQQQLVDEFLNTHSTELFEEMTPDLFSDLVIFCDATKLSQAFTREQLAEIMKRKDSNGTLAIYLVFENKSPTVLLQAIKNFGELPSDWPVDGKVFDIAADRRSVDWMKFLIVTGVKFDITKIFKWLKRIEDLSDLQEIIRAIDKEKAYAGKTNWLFDSDWWQTGSIRANLIDFFVSEFKYDLNTAKQEDEENSKRQSFMLHLMHAVMKDGIYTGLSTLSTIVKKYNLDINQQDEDGETPILVAIDRYRLSELKWLLDNGAKPSSPKGTQPLHVLMSVPKKGPRRPSLETLEFVDLLLAYGADINAYSFYDHNKKQATALMNAAKNNQPIEVIEYLIARGARTDMTGSRGQTLIHYAVRSQNPDLISLLAKYVDINKVDDESYSPLHLAGSYQETESFTTLLKLGADVNQVRRGLTQLMRACLWGHYALIAELIKFNVNYQAVNEQGHSFVHFLLKHQQQGNGISLNECT